MTKKELKKRFKLEHRDEMINIVNECDFLGIKYELIYLEEKENFNWYWLKLFYKDKHIFLRNANLGRHFSKVSNQIVQDKHLTKKILLSVGVKAPRGFIANSLADIKNKIKTEKINFPIVIKPLLLSLGKGVFADINTWADVEKAYKYIRKIDHRTVENPMIVEEYFPARDFRLMVFKGKFLACNERVHPQIVGDGLHTIQELIKKQTKSAGHGQIKLDWEVERCLKDQKMTFDNIPNDKQVIYLRRNANVCTGGLNVNRTKEVCSKYKKIAEQCAKEFNMPLAGIDIMTSDISDPKTDYRVIEINATPDYFMHDDHDIGPSEGVTKKLLKDIFKIK